jgi:hypothetical protein
MRITIDAERCGEYIALHLKLIIPILLVGEWEETEADDDASRHHRRERQSPRYTTEHSDLRGLNSKFYRILQDWKATDEVYCWP